MGNPAGQNRKARLRRRKHAQAREAEAFSARVWATVLSSPFVRGQVAKRQGMAMFPLEYLHPLGKQSLDGLYVGDLIGQIKSIGMLRPLMTYADGGVIDGLRRLKAMRRLGVRYAVCRFWADKHMMPEMDEVLQQTFNRFLKVI